MLGTTGVKDLRIDCIVGVYDSERSQPQPVLVDIELDYDFEGAARSDSVAAAVDYDRVVDSITELAMRREFHLIETMAAEMADLLLSQHAAVRTVRLGIRKPQAVSAASCSFVRLARTR